MVAVGLHPAGKQGKRKSRGLEEAAAVWNACAAELRLPVAEYADEP